MKLNKKNVRMSRYGYSIGFKFHSNKAKCFVAAVMRLNATIIVATR